MLHTQEVTGSSPAVSTKTLEIAMISRVFSCFRQKERPPAFLSETKGGRRSCDGEENRSARQRGAFSRKQLKAHHGNAQHHEHHARGAVEGLGLRTVGKDCGDTRPDERENDAQRPCERIRQSPDGKVGNGAGQGGEGHDENARADGCFQLVAHDAREDEQHHHAAARADEAADHADHRAADERLHRALFRVHLRHRFLRGHHGAQDEFDAQQERHEDGEAAHRRRGDEACRVAADDGEEQHARHHDEAVFDVEILVFVVGVGRDGAREHIGRERDAHGHVGLNAQKGDQHGADDCGGAHPGKAGAEPRAHARKKCDQNGCQDTHGSFASRIASRLLSISASAAAKASRRASSMPAKRLSEKSFWSCRPRARMGAAFSVQRSSVFRRSPATAQRVR